MTREKAMEQELLEAYDGDDVFCDFLHNDAKDAEWCAEHCSLTTPDALCMRRYIDKKYDIK